MGRLFSPPKIPQTPIRTPAPAPVTPPEPENTEPDTPTPEEMRAQKIVDRNRGRRGTIKTSFRGVLSENDLQPQRKSLLGE